jgi:hypothetical protein
LARQPVDRAEPLAKAADDRNTGLAKVRHLLAVHQPGAGVQQVMRLTAGRRCALEQFKIGPPDLRGLERLVVAIVAAEDDDVMVGARVEDAKSVRQVDEERTVAPAIERVSIAGDKADLLIDFGLYRGSNGGSCRSVDAAMSSISSASPPDEVTTPSLRPATCFVIWAAAIASVNSTRSDTSTALWERKSSDASLESPATPPV